VENRAGERATLFWEEDRKTEETIKILKNFF
jgi:hypothetical protein